MLIINENFARAGFLIPPNNAEALAKALLKILHDQALAEQMGRAAREIAIAQFSAACVEKLIRIYERLLTTK